MTTAPSSVPSVLVRLGQRHQQRRRTARRWPRDTWLDHASCDVERRVIMRQGDDSVAADQRARNPSADTGDTMRRNSELRRASRRRSAQLSARCWKSMPALTLPADALAGAAGATTSREATALWNQAARCRGGRQGAGARPTGASPASDWVGQPGAAFIAADVPAQRAHAAAAWPRASRATRRRARACASRCSSGSTRRRPSNYLALNPEAQRKALETKGESIAQGLQHLLARRAAGPPLADRRERVRGRPQRRHDRRRGGVRERAVPAASSTSR